MIETEPRVGPVTLGELRELAEAPPIAGKDDDRMHQIVTKASLEFARGYYAGAATSGVCKAFQAGRCVVQGADTGPCSWNPSDWRTCGVVIENTRYYGKWQKEAARATLCASARCLSVAERYAVGSRPRCGGLVRGFTREDLCPNTSVFSVEVPLRRTLGSVQSVGHPLLPPSRPRHLPRL